jgi:hypothetical protein
MKRFSLKSLLMLVTVVGLFFGYSQWRRHRIIQEADEINRQGILTAELPNEFIDMIWQRQPRTGKGPRYGDYIKSIDPGDGRVS